MVMQETTVAEEIIATPENNIADITSTTADMVVETMQELEHVEAFYEHPTFWVAISFVLVVLLLGRPIGKILHSLLVKRIDNITQRIHDAATLNDDAKKLLAEYEKNFANVKAEANAILKKSKKEIELIKQDRIEKMEAEMQIKRQDAKNRILTAQNEALKEIKNLTGSLTIQAVKTAISDKLDDKTQEKLIDDSIERISKL